MNHYTYTTNNPCPSMEFPGYTITNPTVTPTAPYTFAGYQAQVGTGAQPYSNPCATNYSNLEFQSSEQLMATAQNTQYNNFAGYNVQSVVPNPYSAAPYYNPYQAPAPFYPQYPAPVQSNYYPQYPSPSIPYNYETNPFVTAPTVVVVNETIINNEIVVQNEEADSALIELQSDNLELQNQLISYRAEICTIKTAIEAAEATAAALIPNNDSKERRNSGNSINEEEQTIKLSNLYQQLEEAKESASQCELLIQFSNLKLAEYTKD